MSNVMIYAAQQQVVNTATAKISCRQQLAQQMRRWRLGVYDVHSLVGNEIQSARVWARQKSKQEIVQRGGREANNHRGNNHPEQVMQNQADLVTAR